MKRVVCAHDCGLVVNPDALQHQIEGAITQTLSRALHEEVQFDTSRVTSVDWASYPILRFTELPAIEVILIERRDQPLWGAGEASRGCRSRRRWAMPSSMRRGSGWNACRSRERGCGRRSEHVLRATVQRACSTCYVPQHVLRATCVPRARGLRTACCTS